MQINIESPSGGDIKAEHPGKVKTGHEWTTWDIKWGNNIGSMVGVSGITLDYVMHCDMPVGWMSENKHDHLKYQAIHIGPAWEAKTMSVYTNLKACYLDNEGLSYIKSYNTHRYGRQATENLINHYEGAGEVNQRVVWVMANIDNYHFMSKHT